MNLEEAIELVLNEAETSALGESSSEGNKVLEAVELLQAFYDEHGYKHSNFSLDNVESLA